MTNEQPTSETYDPDASRAVSMSESGCLWATCEVSNQRVMIGRGCSSEVVLAKLRELFHDHCPLCLEDYQRAVLACHGRLTSI